MQVLLLMISMLMQPNNRQIIILYTTATNQLKEQQLKELNADTAGLNERDITITIKLVKPGDTETKKWKISNTESFTFILVGKDGGEKFRSAEMVTCKKLFAIIDAMPMRKAETRRRD